VRRRVCFESATAAAELRSRPVDRNGVTASDRAARKIPGNARRCLHPSGRRTAYLVSATTSSSAPTTPRNAPTAPLAPQPFNNGWSRRLTVLRCGERQVVLPRPTASPLMPSPRAWRGHARCPPSLSRWARQPCRTQHNAPASLHAKSSSAPYQRISQTSRTPMPLTVMRIGTNTGL
jgi:hypothetical protein